MVAASGLDECIAELQTNAVSSYTRYLKRVLPTEASSVKKHQSPPQAGSIAVAGKSSCKLEKLNYEALHETFGTRGAYHEY